MKVTLSVITICFNNPEELIETCRSIDVQTLPPGEHLIIDGSSDERILNWLLQNPQPSYRRWIHERDNGISDAFNKGIRHAKGDVLHLLNSGDRYADRNAIETVIGCFKKDEQLVWVHSQYIQHRGETDIISGVPFEKNKLWKGMRTVAHPSMFIKKEVYARHGDYNTGYKIAMDYDMLVRMRNERFCFIPLPLIYFAPGGTSNLNFKRGLAEVKQIHRKYLGNSFRQITWQLRQRILHSFMQTRIGKRWFKNKNKKNIPVTPQSKER